jgi:hypothetical protein
MHISPVSLGSSLILDENHCEISIINLYVHDISNKTSNHRKVRPLLPKCGGGFCRIWCLFILLPFFLDFLIGFFVCLIVSFPLFLYFGFIYFNKDFTWSHYAQCICDFFSPLMWLVMRIGVGSQVFKVFSSTLQRTQSKMQFFFLLLLLITSYHHCLLTNWSFNKLLKKLRYICCRFFNTAKAKSHGKTRADLSKSAYKLQYSFFLFFDIFIMDYELWSQFVNM